MLQAQSFEWPSSRTATGALGLCRPFGMHTMLEVPKHTYTSGQHARSMTTVTTSRQAVVKGKVTGYVHRWMPSSWSARCFLLITLAEAVVNISIEAVLLSRYNSSEGLLLDGSTTFRALPVFVLCFCLAHSYQVLLSIDSCINRNTILVAGLAIFNACFLVYSIIQISEIRQVLGTGVKQGQTVPVQVLTGAIPVVIGCAQLAYLVLGWYLWKEFGWQIYKAIIGADRMLKKAYQQYQIYVVLLKFDFFAFIAFCLQVSNSAVSLLSVNARRHSGS